MSEEVESNLLLYFANFHLKDHYIGVFFLCVLFIFFVFSFLPGYQLNQTHLCASILKSIFKTIHSNPHTPLDLHLQVPYMTL